MMRGQKEKGKPCSRMIISSALRFFLFNFPGTASTVFFAAGAVTMLKHRSMSAWEQVVAALFFLLFKWS